MYEIYNTSEPEWKSITKNSDIHYSSQYCHLYEKVFGWKAELFLWKSDRVYVIYPYFVRKIDSHNYDIISTYNYGGPQFHSKKNPSKRSIDEFLNDFHNYCLSKKVVSEFVRFHPLFKNHRPFKSTGLLEKNREVVCIDLSLDGKEIWCGFNHACRKNINKAVREGVKIFESKDSTHLEKFYSLYIHTMERDRAKKFYFFPFGFFEDIAKILGDNASFFFAKYQDKIIAAVLFLHSSDIIYAFLGGGDESFFHARPNNLLIYEAALRAKANGFKYFILGGGKDPGDGIYRFKSSFSKKTLPFYIYKKIHIEDAYNRLVAERRKQEGKAGREIITGDFFPEYRKET